MTKIKWLVLAASHALIGLLGVGIGIYLLPILTEPEPPHSELVLQQSAGSDYVTTFSRDLKDSDFLHWGDGKVFVDKESISLLGSIAPGPDYRLYLANEFVQTENRFAELKSNMVMVGEVKTFDNFIVQVPDSIDINDYNTVIVWCESFNQFITSAQYK